MQYKFVFNEQHMMILDAALKELPYKIAIVLINEVNKQLEDQMKKPEMEEVKLEEVTVE